jgi:diaminopimelate decarboxylase
MIVVEGNELHIGQFPVTGLVEKYGEPMYIYDAEVIERQYRKIRAALPEQVEIFYSVKANPNVSIVGFLSHLAQGAEVSSLRELYVARSVGIAPQRILFVGPSKSEIELREALGQGVFCIAVESAQELGLVDQLASEMDRPCNVILRINPAFDAAGSKLKMGGAARQFGIDEEVVEEIFREAASLKCVQVSGIHVYVGTRILDHEVAWKNCQYALELGRRLQEKTGVAIRVIDFGGGLGVPYFGGEHELDVEEFGRKFRSFFSEYQRTMPETRFIMELGRFLVAESGIYLSKVRYTKKSRGQKFVLVGGGMNHHQATTSIGTLIKDHFPIEILNKMALPKNDKVTVCGPLCTPTDVLGKSVQMVEVEPGDLLGILKSGAYGLTASPIKFLSHDHPIEVMVYRGTDYLIRQASAVSDILQHQLLAPLSPRL